MIVRCGPQWGKWEVKQTCLNHAGIAQREIWKLFDSESKELEWEQLFT